MKKLYTWQIDYLTRLYNLDDNELFDELMEATQPDDYDGAFTKRARWRLIVAESIFRERMEFKEEENG